MTDDSDYTSPCNEVNSHGDRCIVQAWHLNDEVQPHEHRFPPRTVERVQPTRDEINQALDIELTRDENWHPKAKIGLAVGASERLADAILALFSSTPTVAQVRGEALREAADEIRAVMTDPDRVRPRVPGGMLTDRLNDVSWAESIVRARADALDPKEEN